MNDIRVLVDCKTILGEGPLWDDKEQRLYWLDSASGRILRCAPDGSDVQQWRVPGKIGSLALREHGGAVLALDSGFHLFDFETGDCPLIVDPEPDLPTTRLNDGKVDPCGRFFAGSMDTEEASPIGALYRLDPDLSVHRLVGGIMVSNGPCWSLDGRIFYFSDSSARTIFAYDYDQKTGFISNRRVFVTFRGGEGNPDGATVDREGGVWTAVAYAGEIRRYLPDGTLDRSIKVPVLKVTSVMFGGPNLDVLFFTSMSKPPLPRFPEDGPLGGSLFAIFGLGVQGFSEKRFAG